MDGSWYLEQQEPNGIDPRFLRRNRTFPIRIPCALRDCFGLFVPESFNRDMARELFGDRIVRAIGKLLRIPICLLADIYVYGLL